MVQISIIIVTWNGKNIVAQCLDSLKQYAHKPATEVIVVDNASTDGTLEMIREQYLYVTLIANSANLGFAKANNIGIERSRGQYVCLVNSDVVVPEECIEKAINYMERNPAIGMLGPKMRLPDGTIGQSCMGFPTVWNWFCRALALDNLSMGRRIFGGFLRTDFQYDQVEDVDVLTGWFWIVTREALNQVGPLDGRYFMYGEDIDWCKRFHQAGWRVVFYPDAEAIHHTAASSKLAPVRFHIEMHRANMQYFEKYHDWLDRAGFWLVTLLHEAIRVVGYSVTYLLRKSRRAEAGFKVRRSAACLSWLIGLTPSEVSKRG
jgi:GT2 family glycosyltransferase